MPDRKPRHSTRDTRYPPAGPVSRPADSAANRTRPATTSRTPAPFKGSGARPSPASSKGSTSQSRRDRRFGK